MKHQNKKSRFAFCLLAIILVVLTSLACLLVPADNTQAAGEISYIKTHNSFSKLGSLTYLLHHGWCGKGNLKIRSAFDHNQLTSCENPVVDFWQRNNGLGNKYQIGVVLIGYVGSYNDQQHANELLNLCVIPDDYFVILRLDTAPNTTLPLIPIKNLHASYQEGVNYYAEYAQTVVDYITKTPCHTQIDAIIVGNEPTFTNPEVACKEQPKAFEYYLGDPESEALRQRVENGSLGKELDFCSVGWRNPKITQVITPLRYAQFFKAISLALKNSSLQKIKIFVAGMELNAELIYNPFLQAISAVGARKFVDGIALHVYSNSLGYKPRCQDQPWCHNLNQNLHGETLYFLGKFLKDLDSNYQGVPLYITESNPWIGWGPQPQDLNLSERIEYIRLMLNTIVFLNSAGYRNQTVSWTPFGWTSAYDDPHGDTRFGLSQFPEVYQEGLKRFVSAHY